MDEGAATQQISSGAGEPQPGKDLIQESHQSPSARGSKQWLRSPLSLPRLRRPRRPFRILTPITIGTVVLVGAAVLWVPLGLIDSAGQRSQHRASVHPDGTAVNTHQLRAFTTPKVLIFQDVNGSLHRILVDETELNRFVNDTLIYLDTERDKIKVETQREVDELLKTAFSDGQACIARYADWYFQWGRSLSFLKEGLVGGMEGLSISNVQTVSESAQNALESYLIRNYERYVLKPELRNPVIEAGVAQILARAHTRYLETLTTIDNRVQLFLGQYTRHLELIDPLKKLDVSVDWDAQKWKVPRYSADNVAFASAFQGVAVSTLVAKTFGPSIERAVSQIFLGVAARIVASLELEIYGTVGGTFIEPGGGSLVGWFAGAGTAVVLDYVSNWQRERLGRAEFEQASVDALQATIGELSRALQRDLLQTVDVWFDDTRAIVAEQKLGRRSSAEVVGSW
jgi:hypothetical protein